MCQHGGQHPNAYCINRKRRMWRMWRGGKLWRSAYGGGPLRPGGSAMSWRMCIYTGEQPGVAVSARQWRRSASVGVCQRGDGGVVAILCRALIISAAA